MKKKLSKLRLGDFRRIYEFFDHRLDESYCVDTAYEDGGDIHEFAGAMYIRICKDSDNAIIKIYDPTYKKPSRKNKVIIQAVIGEHETFPVTKEITLTRMQEKTFFDLIEKIMKLSVLYGDGDEKQTSEVEQKNEEMIQNFITWAKQL